MHSNGQALALSRVTGASAVTPVSAASAALVRPGRALAPATVLPAVAAGSFAAGAAVVGILRRRRTPVLAPARRRGPLRRRSGSAKSAERLQIVASRSLLVDVHLLERRGS